MFEYSYEKIQWNGFDGITFDFSDRKATVIFPKNPCENQKWILKTEYSDAFPNFEIELLNQGYGRVFITNRSRWCVAGDLEAKAALCEFLHTELGWNKKCFLVGMSCGGLVGIYFAATYPQYVAGMYLDAPVTNLLSCPCNVGLAQGKIYDEFCKVTGMTVVDLINYRNHPIDRVDDLLIGNIPILLICGDCDIEVPYEENGKVFAEKYQIKGGTIKSILVPGRGHHPHGLEDMTPMLEFVKLYY